MFLWAVSLVVFYAIGVTESVIRCNGLLFHGVYYDKEVLFEGMAKPYNLVMQSSTGLLFFSHTIWNGSRVDFGVMYCHVQNKKCYHIPGVPGGYAVAHDRINDDIFFGGHDGIYKYNAHKKTAKFFAEKNKSIWGLYVDSYFYYIEYPSQTLFVFERNKFVEVRSAKGIEVDNFFVSRRECFYFSNVTGLFKVHKYQTHPILLKDDVIVRQITDDMYGNIYFCTSDGIYVEEDNHTIKKVVEVEDCFGIAFMEDSTFKHTTDLIIFSSKDGIYRLVPGKYSKFCLRSIQKEKSRLKNKTRTTIPPANDDRMLSQIAKLLLLSQLVQ